MKIKGIKKKFMVKKSKQPFLGQGSLEAFVAYFDTHDLGDELDRLPEVQFDVDIQARKCAEIWRQGG